MRYVALAVLFLVLAGSAGAAPTSWWFKTPGGAAYCGTSATGWRCMRPSDGLWVELTNHLAGKEENVHAAQGQAARYRGFLQQNVRTLGLGRRFETSDAAVVTCRSQADGVACKHWNGLAIWLGRRSGYRIYYETPGFRPTVHPLFRTTAGVWCGILSDTLVPEFPDLLCWRPADGLLLGIAHRDAHGSHQREEQVLGHRPKGFQPLRPGRTYAWRCMRVTNDIAEHCSQASGSPVFTCEHAVNRLTCTNRSGGGFWVDGRAFAVF